MMEFTFEDSLWEQTLQTVAKGSTFSAARLLAMVDSEEELEDAFAAACSETNILYAAARDLKMIPAEAAEAVYLVPVDTRPLLTASQPAQNVSGDMTVQTTHIPVAASAGN